MGANKPLRLRWKLAFGGIAVIAVFIASSPLPGPFNIVVPVTVGMGLGGMIGKSREQQ